MPKGPGFVPNTLRPQGVGLLGGSPYRSQDKFLDALLALGPRPRTDAVEMVLALQPELLSAPPNKLTGYLTRLGRLERHQAAVVLLLATRSAGYDVNTVHFNAAIAACARGRG